MLSGSRPSDDAEHAQLRDTTRRFIAAEIVPHFNRWEEAGIVERSLWDRLGEAGHPVAPPCPRKYGGIGGDFRMNAVVAEELAYSGFTGPASDVSVHSDVCLGYLVHHGTEEPEAPLAAGHGRRHDRRGDRHDRARHRQRTCRASGPRPGGRATNGLSTAPRPSSRTGSIRTSSSPSSAPARDAGSGNMSLIVVETGPCRLPPRPQPRQARPAIGRTPRNCSSTTSACRRTTSSAARGRRWRC